jgi:hypothetical protein
LECGVPDLARDPLSKIHDAAVRQLAVEESEVPVDVLIELDLPVPMQVTRRAGGGVTRSLTTAPAGATESAGAAFERFGVFLRGLGVGSPTPPATANAYAARLPARALLAVARNPLVHGVAANRRLVA